MKAHLLTCSAAMALTLHTAPSALAMQAPDTPAGATQRNPQPSLSEELVYLRDRMAVQTLRLDEAEQLLKRQQRLIELQEQKIVELERQFGVVSEQANAAAAAQRTSSRPQQVAQTSNAGVAGVYTVRRNDTLWSIARRNKVNVNTLIRENGLSSPDKLRVGQQLKIPGRPAQARVAAAQTSSQQKAAAPKQQPRQQKKAGSGQAPKRVAQAQNGQAKAKPPAKGLPQEVGVRPKEEDKKPYISIFSDVGGILTPRGTFFIEPETDVTTSTDSRFFFRGTEIASALLIGFIEATDTDRRAATGRMGFRYGITSRIEADARIAGVYRDDRITGVDVRTSNDFVRDLEGSGLGDIDFGLKYQVNQGKNWPYVVANVRAKAPTGQGPFDVSRDANGIETELPTGSGFWTVEPSLTFIMPSDPAVLFANVGFQKNLSTSPDLRVGDNVFRKFNPGDAIKTSLGVGLSLNERMSINFGYDQSYFFKTVSHVDQLDPDTGAIIGSGTLEQPSTVVGSFLFGGSYAVNDRVRLNLNTAFGATTAAPDMRVALKAQVKLFQRKKKAGN